MELQDLKSVLDEHRKSLDAAVEKYEGQLKENGKVAAEARDEVKTLAQQYAEMNAAITALGQKLSSGPAAAEPSLLSAGEEVVRSEKFKALQAGNLDKIRIEVKNTLHGTTTTTMPTQMSGFIPGVFEPLTVSAILRKVPVTSNAVNSLREASWTNAAAEVSEGGTKAESTLTFEQYNVSISTIAHWIKVSEQLMADAPAIQAYIDGRLRDGLAQRLDFQLIRGNGTAPALSGFTDSGNYTAYTPASGDLLVDAVNRAKYALWAKGYVPDAVILNPADWGAMERTREYAGSGYAGAYMAGTPGQALSMSPFGLRVVLSNHVTDGEMILGAFNTAAVLYTRQGATVEIGRSGTDFVQNLYTIRAEMRCGLGVEQPNAILYGDFVAT